MSDFELVWDSRCGVAECPTWDAAKRRVLFCDIGGKKTWLNAETSLAFQDVLLSAQ